MTEALIQHDKMSQKPLKNVLEIGTGWINQRKAILKKMLDAKKSEL